MVRPQVRVPLAGGDAGVAEHDLQFLDRPARKYELRGVGMAGAFVQRERLGSPHAFSATRSAFQTVCGLM